MAKGPWERMFIDGKLHAEEPNWVGASVRGRIAVKEVAHRLVKVALPCFAAVKSTDDLPLKELEGRC